MAAVFLVPLAAAEEAKRPLDWNNIDWEKMHATKNERQRAIIRDFFRGRRAGTFVDVGPVMDEKTAMLACHKSQQQWLDASQGLNSYLEAMKDLSREVGQLSGQFEYAEGWRRHLHLGLCEPEGDPLTAALGARVVAASRP